VQYENTDGPRLPGKDMETVRKGTKKLVTGLVAAALVVAVAGVALAQGPSGDRNGIRDLDGVGRGPAWGFVDEDGDGVNDRWQDGEAFADEDGDGVCDLCGGEAGSGYAGRATGRGGRRADEDGGSYGPRFGDGDRFVDKDGDGVCDLCDGEPGEECDFGGRAMGRSGRMSGRWAAEE
jgi:hypothetical protein